MPDVLAPKLKPDYNKKILFNKLKPKGAFWCYLKMISYQELGEDLLIEHALKVNIRLCFFIVISMCYKINLTPNTNTCFFEHKRVTTITN